MNSGFQRGFLPVAAAIRRVRSGVSPSTPSAARVASVAAACARVAAHLEAEIERLRRLRERPWDALDGALPDTLRLGDPEQCLPYGTS